VTGYRLSSADPFDGATNRGGCINLGTAENKLCAEKLREKLSEPACGGAALQAEDFLCECFVHEQAACGPRLR